MKFYSSSIAARPTAATGMTAEEAFITSAAGVTVVVCTLEGRGDNVVFVNAGAGVLHNVNYATCVNLFRPHTHVRSHGWRSGRIVDIM